MPSVTLPSSQKIHYLDHAPTNATPSTNRTILLLHGLGSSQNYYIPIIPDLTSSGYRCVALDTPGSARSSIPTSQHTVKSLATEILAFMDVVKIDKAIVVGHSMSAGLTVPAMAGLARGRIQAIVLLGPVYPSKELTPAFEERIEKVQGEKGMQAMADTIPYAALGSKATGLQRAMVRELLSGQRVEGYVGNCKVIGEAWREREREQEKVPDYEGIECPVLIVASDEDKSAPVAGCERILKETGKGRLQEGKEKSMVVLKGYGHWQCVEAPDEVAKCCVEFLKEQGL